MDRAEIIKELDELAEMTPPICLWDSPKTVEVGGRKVTVYCKPFEQFQSLVKQAADALREQAVQPSKEGNCEQEQSKAVQPFNEGATHNREQWISVKERLPKEEWEKICKEQNAEIYPCLCYRRSSSHYDKWYVTKAYFDGEYFVDLDNIIIDEYVTHWMPLPEPPKEGADHE